MDETRQLAHFLAGLKYDGLGSEVIEAAKDHILDQFGVELAASTKPVSLAVYRYIRDFGGPAESTIVNYGDKAKAESAAFANAAFGHGFEMDDTYFPGNAHPACVVVPAALALCEREIVDGKTFLVAVVAGYEAMGRIARSVAPSCINRGFHPTAATGTFGAAAAVGKVLGFDDELMLNALSVAGSHSSGLNEFTRTGGQVKRIHAGIAASGGMRAALLVRAGLTGPPTLLEGASGFWHAFSDEFNPERLTSGFGKDFVLMGTSYKRYACCHQLHAAIDATSKIVTERKVRPDDIEAIVMGTNKAALSIVGTITEPQDVTESQFSAAFSLAMCVVKGGNGFSDYNDDNLRDPGIRKLANRVRLELDNEVDAEFPAKRAVRVTVRLKNGESYQEKLDGPRGTPENPISRSEVQDKFRSLAAMVLPAARAEEIVKTVQRLDSLGSITTLSRLLVS